MSILSLFLLVFNVAQITMISVYIYHPEGQRLIIGNILICSIVLHSICAIGYFRRGAKELTEDQMEAAKFINGE